MASLRSRSTDYFPHRTMPSSVRQLQEALYTHLEDQEKKVFIEALSTYGANRDVFELVNALRKILNTPVKRELLPLVKRVIKQEDVDAFDLLTRDDKQYGTMPRPFLYRPHIADLTVLSKSRTLSGGHKTPSHSGTMKSDTLKSAPAILNRTGQKSSSSGLRGEKHKTLSRSSSKSNLLGEVVEVNVGEPDGEDGGYGFTIRGGADIGVGIYVSSVDNGSNAQVRGLAVGDLIVEANNISFSNVSHDEAARIIKAATRLHLRVSRVGRVPGRMTLLETFTWTDPKGRPVSPPLPGSGLAAGEDDDGRRKSGTQMLKGSDERKVNMVVQKGQGLGIMVRGGNEYGLGIFISGIDPFSVAENAGLKLGDQILDVNGRSFLDISHAEAVKHLKKRRHLIMTVRDVGKIPFSKTTIEESGWIESTKVESYERSSSSRRSASGSVTNVDTHKKMLLRGLGTQLMLSSPNRSHNRGHFQEQVRLLLNESEQASLNYYLAEYEKGLVSIQGLVQALFELLNTIAKFTLMSEIRLRMKSNDLAIFDEMLVKREMDQTLNDARKLLSSDVMSIGSYDSDDVKQDEMFKKTYFSQQKSTSHQVMENIQLNDKYSQRPEISRRGLSASSPNLTRLDLDSLAERNRARPRTLSRSPYSAHNLRLTSPNSTMERQYKGDNVRTIGKLDDPSDDSGVEIHGQVIMDQGNGPPYHSKIYQPIRSKHLQHNNKHRTSTQDTLLNHLNYSKKVDPENGNGSMSRRRVPEMKTSKSADDIHFQTKKNGKDHFRVIEHVAEVHRPHQENEDMLKDSRYGIRSSDDAYQHQSAQSKHVSTDMGISRLGDVSNRVQQRSGKPRSSQSAQDTRQESNHKKNEVTIKVNGAGDQLKVDTRGVVKPPDSSPHSVRFRSNDSYITINGYPGPPPQRHQTIIQNTYTPAPPPPPPPPSPPSSHREHLINSFKVDIEGRTKAKSSRLSHSPRDFRATEQSSQNTTPESTAHSNTADHEGAPPDETANQSKKQRLFSSPGKTGSKKLSAGNRHSTTITVPLIKVNSDVTPHVAASLDRRGASYHLGHVPNDYMKSKNGKSSFAEDYEDTSSAHVNERNTQLSTSFELVNGSAVVQRQRKNVTRITVGGGSTTHNNLPVEGIKEKAAEKYGDIPLDVVYVYRSKPTLGVAIEGGANTRQPLPKVINVQPGGSAYESGGLRVGHVILEVNGQPAVGLSHGDAARLIAEAFKNKDNDRMELLVTEWSDTLLDTITVDVGLLKV